MWSRTWVAPLFRWVSIHSSATATGHHADSSGQTGELRVQGIDLKYEYGRQSGTQRVGEYVWLRYE